MNWFSKYLQTCTELEQSSKTFWERTLYIDMSVAHVASVYTSCKHRSFIDFSSIKFTIPLQKNIFCMQTAPRPLVLLVRSFVTITSYRATSAKTQIEYLNKIVLKEIISSIAMHVAHHALLNIEVSLFFKYEVHNPATRNIFCSACKLLPTP